MFPILRNHLSALLSEVKAGETVVITDHDRPVAQITAVVAHDWDEQIMELARQGILRLPISDRRMTLEELQANRVDLGDNPGVLEALLEERREGR